MSGGLKVRWAKVRWANVRWAKVRSPYLTPNNFLFLKFIVSAYSAPECVMNSQVKLNVGLIILT